MPTGVGTKAISVVRRFFPHVSKVTDADTNATIEVNTDDQKGASRRDHNGCALAVACKRTFKVKGVIISASTAYIVKGREAIRYRVPERITREIISFDRGAEFETGTYKLNAPKKAHRLGYRQGGDHNGHGKVSHKVNGFSHVTGGIRAVLGGRGSKGEWKASR